MNTCLGITVLMLTSLVLGLAGCEQMPEDKSNIGLTARSALLSQSMPCGRLPKSSDTKSVGIGKLAQAALRAAAGELDLAAAGGCLSFTTGFGLQCNKEAQHLASSKKKRRVGFTASVTTILSPYFSVQAEGLPNTKKMQAQCTCVALA